MVELPQTWKLSLFLALMTCGGLFQDYIVEDLVCLGGDSAFKFQRVKFGVIALMRMEQAP
jgi:hypothetical protein